MDLKRSSIYLLFLLFFLFPTPAARGERDVSVRIDDETRQKWLRAYREAEEAKRNLKIPEETYRDVLNTLKAVSERYGIKFDRIVQDETVHEVDKKAVEEQKKSPSERYLLFISSSVDREVIRNYASFFKGRILFLLRGFVGVSTGGRISIRPTITWWADIFREDFSKRKIPSLSIDPESFRKEGIEAVPALFDPTRNCVVYGDVAPERLIEAIKEKECGKTFGRTWPVNEADGLSQIYAYIRTIGLDRETLKRRFESFLLSHFQGFKCLDLPSRETTVVYRKKPVYELDFDIRDPNTGAVLYPRGFRFNPLEYVSPVGSFLVIDGEEELQLRALEYLVKEAPRPVRVLLTAGDVFSVRKVLPKEVSVFPSCLTLKRLLAYGACQNVPCLVSFDPPYLRVKEIGTSELEQYLERKPNLKEEKKN